MLRSLWCRSFAFEAPRFLIAVRCLGHACLLCMQVQTISSKFLRSSPGCRVFGWTVGCRGCVLHKEPKPKTLNPKRSYGPAAAACPLSCRACVVQGLSMRRCTGRRSLWEFAKMVGFSYNRDSKKEPSNFGTPPFWFECGPRRRLLISRSQGFSFNSRSFRFRG